MNRSHFTIAALLILCNVQMSAQDTYHYNAGKRVTLQCYPQRQFVLFQTSEDTVTAYKLLNQAGIQHNSFHLSTIAHRSPEFSAYYWTILDIFGEETCPNINEYYGTTFYITEYNDTVGVSDLLYVKLFDIADTLTLKSQASLLGVNVVERDPYMPLWYTLSCSNQSVGNAIEISKKMYETGLFCGNGELRGIPCDEIGVAES